MCQSGSIKTTVTIRYDGKVPNDSTYPTVQVRDPRSALTRIRSRIEATELTVPKFRIDDHYVGAPPPLEVSITNINDNIDKAFLAEMVHECGELDELMIFYHPRTNKHLGLAQLVFRFVHGAKACVETLNKKSVMGKVLSVFLDPFGAKVRQMYNDLLEDRPVPREERPPAREDPLAVWTEPERHEPPEPEPEHHEPEPEPEPARVPAVVAPPPAVPFGREDSGQRMDLDTRIALLLQHKSKRSLAPSFAQLLDSGGEAASSESMSDSERSSDDEPPPPLSVTPSPFLSRESYLQSHRLACDRLAELRADRPSWQRQRSSLEGLRSLQELGRRLGVLDVDDSARTRRRRRRRWPREPPEPPPPPPLPPPVNGAPEPPPPPPLPPGFEPPLPPFPPPDGDDPGYPCWRPPDWVYPYPPPPGYHAYGAPPVPAEPPPPDYDGAPPPVEAERLTPEAVAQ
ncbi:Histone-lysine N-methyltransferase SETD1 [Amphibalanus amphitrite]|uniref:Histone-lysine N-methyltransferase SETD1 n=1 Tax=Amphibalanus amphitrite TaxID=1232801 RepID=A0A6A4W5G4_AMPAM|nr:Histone-lysine N-methyltransferase SETD1 [Amphibalanus amphitrite]